ncbi:MAG TPA: PEP/pyruvate-binding domain-containing protein [Rhodocyclaceae bacterium]
MTVRALRAQWAADAVRPLAAIAAEESARFGAKATQLARLARAGLPVPAGFCIACDALPDQWYADDELPAALAAAIRRAYRYLGATRVAVRSSAGDEDQAAGSAAGLYTTRLGIADEAALFAAIRSCWLARLAPRARHGRGGETAMAVLVQAQVAAEAAGVLFTADPLSGARDRIVINAVWGLGEPLASGRIGGDVFHATPTGVLSRQILSCKSAMLTAQGERPVAQWRRHAPALSAPQVRRLVGLARQVATLLPQPGGEALDIEFAIERGQPLLLQARPIPLARQRLDPLAAYLEEERAALAAHVEQQRRSGVLQGDEVVLSAGNIGELLPTPCAFSFALFRHIFAGRDGAIVRGRRRLGYRLGEQAGEGLFVQVGGQAYFNLEVDAATYDLGVALPLAELLQTVSAEPAQASYPELDLYPRLLAAAPGGSAAAAAFRRRLLRQGRRLQGRLPQLLALLQAPPERDLAALDLPALQAELAASLTRLRRLGLRFVIAARLGFFFADTLRRRLQELLPERAERVYASLLQGLPGSLITEQGLDMERLATGEIDAGQFLQRYGHMASNELELLHPRLAEIPERLARQVEELRASRRRPGAEFARQARRCRRTEAALRRRYVHTAPEALAELCDDLRMAQTYLPLRETLKFHLAALYAPLRPLLQAIAARLGCPADSLFHLTPQEVLALNAAELGDALALAGERQCRRELARQVARSRPLPRVIFTDRADALNAAADSAPADAELQSLAASPIAPGIAEGVVYLLTLDEDELDQAPPELGGGEILVATSANLGLAPLFRTAAGVVVEVGGVLAHSACQAREAGIPALVLADATSRLRSGDRVRLDAQRGLITILQRATVSDNP